MNRKLSVVYGVDFGGYSLHFYSEAFLISYCHLFPLITQGTYRIWEFQQSH